MQKIDIAVIGSGIGGSLISALNSDKNLVLFEQDSNLGGCASTFKRFGYHFNAGATTFVGYEDNHIIKEMFDKIGLNPNILQSKIAIRNIQKDKIVDRTQDFEEFLKELDKTYYHPNNRVFWEKIKSIDEEFWKLKKVYFSKSSFNSLLKTGHFIIELLKVFKTDLLQSANGFIKSTLPNISDEYMKFIDSQLLITLQTKSENATLLSMSLGLSYPFHKVFYVNNGMGSLIEELLKKVEVKKKEKVLSVEKSDEYFSIETTKNKYLSKKVILNSTIFDSSKMFKNKSIKSYFEKFSFSDQSAFVVYLKLNVKKELLHHYQIILEKDIPNCVSNSFFVSFSDVNDTKLSKDGLSVTISSHTKAIFWENLSDEEYLKKKQETQKFIIEEFFNYFNTLKSENIIKSFSATSKTFNSFINRTNCGGKPINLKSVLEIPSCDTPFDGLYSVGDTIFAGQGWLGIALGVKVLNEEINAKC